MGDIQLYVVRVWRHLSQFRASVRAADDDTPRFFDDPTQVGSFLDRASQVAADAGDGSAAPAARDGETAAR